MIQSHQVCKRVATLPACASSTCSPSPTATTQPSIAPCFDHTSRADSSLYSSSSSFSLAAACNPPFPSSLSNASGPPPRQSCRASAHYVGPRPKPSTALPRCAIALVAASSSVPSTSSEDGGSATARRSALVVSLHSLSVILLQVSIHYDAVSLPSDIYPRHSHSDSQPHVRLVSLHQVYHSYSPLIRLVLYRYY